MKKVLIIGMDGVTPDLLLPWVQAGYLPNIAGLINQGVYGPLESVIHPHSPPAWTSFLTGQNPGKHGIFEFSQREPGTYRWRVTSSRVRKAPALWELLGNETKSAFYFVPMTFPPESLNGIMVSGLGTPGLNSAFTYPSDLKSEILNQFPRDTILEPSPGGADGQRYLQLLWRNIQDQTSIALQFTPEETDLTMIVFGQTDRVQHFFWRQLEEQRRGRRTEYGDAILKTYQVIDAQIGRLTEAASSEAAIILMSDHGMGPYEREFYLNNWLSQNGFLQFKDEVQSLRSRVVSSTLAAVRRHAKGRIRDFVRLLGRQDWLSSLNSSLRNPLASLIDWPSTKAYSFGDLGNIYLNLRGREPLGTVEPDVEAGRILNMLEQGLLQLRDPGTGDRVVQQVLRGEQLYTGEATKDAPDLVLVCYDNYFAKGELHRPYDVVFTSEHKIRVSDFPHTARHRLNGVFAAKGPVFRHGAEPESPSLMDLFPTILYLLGQPIPPDLDGRCLTEIMEADYLASNPPKMVDHARPGHGTGAVGGLSKEEEELVEAQLRGLGYLE